MRVHTKPTCPRNRGTTIWPLPERLQNMCQSPKGIKERELVRPRSRTQRNNTKRPPGQLDRLNANDEERTDLSTLVRITNLDDQMGRETTPDVFTMNCLANVHPPQLYLPMSTGNYSQLCPALS